MKKKSVSLLRPARGGFVFGVAFLLLSCGSAELTAIDASEGRDSLPAAAADDLHVRVAQAYLTNTAMPSTLLADYLATNHQHMVDAAACMKRAGFPGYAVTLPPITEEMVQGFSIPVGWLPPPVSLTGPADVSFLRRFDELLARSERESNIVDPRFDEPKFQEAQTRCENEAPFESTIDWSPVEKLAAEMDSISSSSMKDPEFDKLANAYATCVKASGESFSHPDEIQDAYSGGEITREVLDLQISVDDRCRAPLYQKFIALSADDWESFLQSRGAELNRIAVDWQEITASSGLS